MFEAPSPCGFGCCLFEAVILLLLVHGLLLLSLYECVCIVADGLFFVLVT